MADDQLRFLVGNPFCHFEQVKVYPVKIRFDKGKINLPGTWTKEGSKLTINFAKLFTFKLVGTIKTTSTGCQLLFDADKFVGFISKVLEVVNKVANNSTLASVQQMLANAKGVQLGFKLAK